MSRRSWVLGTVLLLTFVALLFTLLSGRASPSQRPNFQSRQLEAIDFDVGFAELKKYKASKGNLMVPQNSVVEVNGVDIKLGHWVQRLRQLYKNTVSIISTLHATVRLMYQKCLCS